MAYSYDQIFAADPANPSNIAQNAAITIFAPGDVTMTPLTITDPDGQPLANPIPVNANGFGSAFAHATLDRVAWAGGGFTGFFTSYEGMKNEAVAARTAAEAAAATAGAEAAAVATAAIGDATDEATAAAASAATAASNASASATAAANSAALVGAPADSAVQTLINNAGSSTSAALNATFVPKWKATTAYLAGDKVVSPDGDVVSAKASFTSGASYSAANWNVSASFTPAAAESVNADHAAGFSRVQRAFLGPPAGLFLARSGNDYTFLRGLGTGRYEAVFLPRFAQSLNGVTYTVNCISGSAIQMPMLSVDDGNGTYGGSWANQFTSTITSPGYKATPLTVNTTSGSGTITFTAGTVTSADVGRRVNIPGAGVAGATLESTINSVSGSTFNIGTAPSATLTGIAATIYPSYRYNATAGATATWTSPASSTALAVGVLTAQNGGLAKVTIDTDATLANLLPTAQQMVDSARYPNTILVANGGTLNPTDRVLDCYSGSATTFYDQKKMIAEGLTAAAHTVVLTVTGYTPTGGTGARTYIDRFASATAATTPTTAGAEMFTAFDLSPGFASAWEYAIDCKPTSGSTFTFVGQNAHQLEDQTGFTIYIDDLGATPADGSITACNSAMIVRTTKLFHPEVGAALNSNPIATSTVTYRLDRRGLAVTPDLIGGTMLLDIRTAYSMAAYVARNGVPTKMDRASMEASATTLTMTGSDARLGFSRSASAWVWDSTGKVGAAMYIPDHFGFTDGYTVPGLSQVEDRGGSVPTTKFYFPWIGPNVTKTLQPGWRKRWTTRYMVGYFADANATLAVL